MSPELAKLTILIGAVAVLLGLTLALQSRRISHVWLRWIPRTVREPISPYFDTAERLPGPAGSQRD